jgi:ribosomal protein S18 acetylase RimI-like enzyme
MNIREFKSEDAEAVIAVQDGVKDCLGDLYTKESIVQDSSYINFFVAEDEGKIVGYIGFTDLKNGIGMTLSLAVAKDQHGKGVGSALVEKVIEYATANSFRKVLTLVRVNNAAMIGLSKKKGFVEEGVLKRHFRTGEDVMYLSYFIEANYPEDQRQTN